MRRFTILALFMATAAVLSTNCFGWGANTQSAIVSAGVHVLSQDRAIPLQRYLKYINEGASISAEEQARLFPGFKLDGVSVIESEMYLLESVRGRRIDPYFAYRLGVLGKLVTQVVAPLSGSDPTYRQMYFDDVDKQIQKVNIRPHARRLAEAQAYFAYAIRQARTQDDTIVVDYRSGIGFNGLASKLLETDASRAVDAVADVWHTIFDVDVPFANISRSQMRTYLLGSLSYYLAVDRFAEAKSVTERAGELGVSDEDLNKAFGDLYFEAEAYEQAMEQYRAVLAVNPRQREVVQNMSEYYVRMGNAAVMKGELLAGREAFTTAKEIDGLHPNAAEKLLNVNKLISNREDRFLLARDRVVKGQTLQAQAENHAIRQEYAQAIELMNAAYREFDGVGDEFDAESLASDMGKRDVSQRIAQYKKELIESAQAFSGSGLQFDTRHVVGTMPDVNERALRAILRDEYKKAMEAMQEEMEASEGTVR